MLGYIFESNRAQVGRQVGGRFLFYFRAGAALSIYAK